MSSVIPMPGPSEFVRLVAANVRSECGRLDWFQADAARALGVSPQTINIRWRGQRQWQLEDLEKLAAAMGVPVQRFFARPEGLEPPTFWSVVSEDDKGERCTVVDMFTREAVA